LNVLYANIMWEQWACCSSRYDCDLEHMKIKYCGKWK